MILQSVEEIIYNLIKGHASSTKNHYKNAEFRTVSVRQGGLLKGRCKELRAVKRKIHQEEIVM